MFIAGVICAAIVIGSFIFLLIFINKNEAKIKKYEKFLVIFIICMIILGIVALGLTIGGGIKQFN